jgi:plastocyanin
LKTLAALLLAFPIAVAAAEAAAQEGVVEGRVSLGFPGVDLGSVGEIVVFVEPEGGQPTPAPRGAAKLIRQRDARFDPQFLVVVAGQRVELPNDDLIFHNVFSFSKPNDFDLGTYPRGESRSVVFRYPGLVRVYCSIHESMSASVFVVPTPWHAVAAADGSFAIRGVPEGRWRLHAWSWRLPGTSHAIAVSAGRSTRVELALGARSSAPAAAAP